MKDLLVLAKQVRDELRRKPTDISGVLAQLRRDTERAYAKMELEQKRDPCCVWHEFEALILDMTDYLDALDLACIVRPIGKVQ